LTNRSRQSPETDARFLSAHTYFYTSFADVTISIADGRKRASGACATIDDKKYSVRDKPGALFVVDQPIKGSSVKCGDHA